MQSKMNKFESLVGISILLAISAAPSNAFTVTPSSHIARTFVGVPKHAFSISSRKQIQTRTRSRPSSLVGLYDTADGNNQNDDEDSEIERLRSMAAKLRAEAAALEADKAQQLADAAETAFRKFDTNQDGEISFAELKAGLEKVLKTELSEKRVNQLMKEFDASGDGALQLDEFVGVDQFRNRLEALAREEKRIAAEAKKQAKLEEEAAALAAARLEILNDKPPTMSDKTLSLLPYLFPLMDGLQYGRFLLGAEGSDANPFVVVLAILYSLYRTIPFSGFIAFFALNFLSGNPSINRLVRFNMQQAIFLDIALFFPGLFSGLAALALGGLGVQLPTAVTELSTDAIFVSLLLMLAYCSVSSLLGIAPDKIPYISQAVNDRMPTVDMFDDEGRYVPQQLREEQKEDKKDETKDDKKNDE